MILMSVDGVAFNEIRQRLRCDVRFIQRVLSHNAVAQLWRKHGIKPHRLEGYMASNDPEFERKAADINIIGLYLNPPVHAAVFCGSARDAPRSVRETAHSPTASPSESASLRHPGVLPLVAYAGMNPRCALTPDAHST